jgi:hypothetical protein
MGRDAAAMQQGPLNPWNSLAAFLVQRLQRFATFSSIFGIDSEPNSRVKNAENVAFRFKRCTPQHEAEGCGPQWKFVVEIAEPGRLVIDWFKVVHDDCPVILAALVEPGSAD